MAERHPDPDQQDHRDEAELEELGYRPNVNQVRQEPIPASSHAEPRQEAQERSEEQLADASAPQPRESRAAPAPGRQVSNAAPTRPDGEVDTRG